MNLKELISGFLEFHAADSDATLNTFRSILQSYSRWHVAHATQNKLISRELVIAYLEKKRSEGLAQKSLHLHWNVLSLLAKYAWRKARIISPDDYEDIAELSRKYKAQTTRKRRALTKQEMQKVEEHLQEISSPVQTLVYFLGVRAGLRVEEMTNLTIHDIHLSPKNRDPYMLIKGKGAGHGKKYREVVILPELKIRLNFYLEYRELLNPKDDYLLITERGTKVAKRTIQHWVKNWATACNITELTPHVLRHTYAAEMRRRGISEQDLQVLMGHASVSTTANYGRVAASEIHERVLKKWRYSNESY